MASPEQLGKAKEFNKIAGAVIGAMLVTMIIGKIGSTLVSPRPLAQAVYPVPAASEATTTQTAAAPAAIDPIGPQLAAASVEAGQAVARRDCAQCHTFTEGGRNLVGPNLHGVVGRARASVAGFNYSQAMRSNQAAWSYESLNQYLTNPRGYVRGTNMAFAGLRRAEDRANLIRWMRDQGSQSVPLP
jgi:cytochrome c